MKDIINKISSGNHLDACDTERAFLSMIRGELDPVQIAALLIGLRTKGESPVEILGAARALRASCAPFERPAYDTVDSCGTGGDGSHTINVSTATAIVAAQMGLKVAKHGNRSISSRCGSADVLEMLGVRIDATSAVSRRCLDEVGICFLFAPLYHPGLRHAGPVRSILGVRTVMNVLGPLVNPASPDIQVMGVYDPKLVEPIAEVLGALGCRSAMVVHGSGLDEVAVHGPTHAVWFRHGELVHMAMSPAQAGLDTYHLADIEGGDPQENAAILMRILQGKGKKAHNAAVAINAGALAMVAGIAADLREGTAMALDVLASGSGAERLLKFAEYSHGA